MVEWVLIVNFIFSAPNGIGTSSVKVENIVSEAECETMGAAIAAKTKARRTEIICVPKGN